MDLGESTLYAFLLVSNATDEITETQFKQLLSLDLMIVCLFMAQLKGPMFRRENFELVTVLRSTFQYL